MYLKNLHLLNFKNYREENVSFISGINCFVGNNGAGKTNILDAIHYLSICRSFLNTSDKQNIHFDERFFSIKGTFHKNDRDYTIHCAVKAGEKKIVHQNKKAYEKLAEHIGLFPSVIISPYDKNLIAEGSELRRKWIDSIIAQADRQYLIDLQRYNRIILQRNILLKTMFQNNSLNTENLEIWDAQLNTIGLRIHQSRIAFLSKFTSLFHKYYQQISTSTYSVDIQYRSQLSEENFEALLKNARHKDFLSQYTSVGIHKDDFIFLINERPIKKFGSQGQQKSFVIALRLAQYEWLKNQLTISPILLLDDIFDKLDHLRVQQLIEIVASDFFGQVMITDTDRQRLERTFKNNNIHANIFQIENNQAHLL